MPNLWTSATQNIFEAFQGPRTKDDHFNGKMDEMKRLHKGMLCVKTTLENVKENTEGFKNIYKDLSEGLFHLFDKKSPYSKILNNILDTNDNLIKVHDTFNKYVTQLISRTSEWDQIFSKIKTSYDERENKRKIFDHYDEKMEKLIKNKAEKVNKHIPETKKDIELYERVIIFYYTLNKYFQNQIKYQDATEEYINFSLSCNDQINYVFEKRDKIVIPVICDLIKYEELYFKESLNSFKGINNLHGEFEKVINEMAILRSKNIYDPTKFIRGGNLVKSDKIENVEEKAENTNEDKPKANLEIYKVKEYSNIDEFLEEKTENNNTIEDNNIKKFKAQLPLNYRKSNIINFAKIENHFAENEIEKKKEDLNLNSKNFDNTSQDNNSKLKDSNIISNNKVENNGTGNYPNFNNEYKENFDHLQYSKYSNKNAQFNAFNNNQDYNFDFNFEDNNNNEYSNSTNHLKDTNLVNNENMNVDKPIDENNNKEDLFKDFFY